jgi:hypothetical protein
MLALPLLLILIDCEAALAASRVEVRQLNPDSPIQETICKERSDCHISIDVLAEDTHKTENIDVAIDSWSRGANFRFTSGGVTLFLDKGYFLRLETAEVGSAKEKITLLRPSPLDEKEGLLKSPVLRSPGVPFAELEVTILQK